MAEGKAGRRTTNNPPIRFEAQLRKVDRWTIISLPDDASAKLPSRGQVAVVGVINRQAFQTVLEPDGRRGHWLKVGKKLRQTLEVSEGDSVTVEVAPTKDWPEPDVPTDFRIALTHAPDVSEVWNGVTPMARWEWVRWINATKNPETRKRRVEVGISKLQSGKRRPCCFDLSACTDPDLGKNGRLIDGV